MNEIPIKSRLYDYSITFTDDFTKNIHGFGKEMTYIIDKNVYELYKDKFQVCDISNIFLVEAVEKNKNMDTVMDIILFWKNIGVKKNWKVLCFGGGITQDLTTIASNLYLRNIEWYFFPTTLLAMCDSCIGGKCGINLGQYKNQLGVFYPPHKIIIDTQFLSTISKDDYLNGWGELLKFSLTSEMAFYRDLKNVNCYIPCEQIQDFICRGLYVKKKIIEEDEFETDLRRVLNYGHTFGHALEAYTNNNIPHGQGVIWGIDVVNYIAYKEKMITENLYLDIKSLIKREFIKKEIIIEDSDRLFGIIRTDKKVKGNIISFAMLDSESHLIVYPMEIDQKLKKYFTEYLETTHEYYCN